MSNYQPGPDETALLTVEVRLGTDGIYVIEGEHGGARMFLHSTSPAIVRVEPLPKPALPTAFGSRIVATISTTASTVRTELVRVHDDPVPSPWVTRSGVPYGSSELADVEVLHDPDATKLTAEASAPVPEPEPLELPTGFGAVVSATYEGETAMAVRADPLSPASWFVSLPRSRTRWAADDELTRAVILGPGIDVDLP